MEYITLGKTGLKISRLGFGGIPIQRVDAAAAGELLEAVRAAGINYIDTARGLSLIHIYRGAGRHGGRKAHSLVAHKGRSTHQNLSLIHI